MSARNKVIPNILRGQVDGAAQIPNVLRGHFAPDAADAVYQEGVRILRFKRDQSMEVFLVGFDVLRQEAYPRMQLGGGFHEAVASVLCMHDASLSKSEEPLVLARIQGTRMRQRRCVNT